MIILAYAKQLGIKTQQINVEAQKIDSLSLKTFKIIIAIFQVVNKLGRVKFFQETLLLAETSMKVVLRMLFFTLSYINIYFAEKNPAQRTYSLAEILLIMRKLKLINKKKFAKTVLDNNIKAFLIHVSSLNLKLMIIYLAQKAQIAPLLLKELACQQNILILLMSSQKSQ